jgi:hypothetical protein
MVKLPKEQPLIMQDKPGKLFIFPICGRREGDKLTCIQDLRHAATGEFSLAHSPSAKLTK